ncbi:Fimbrial domain-containing protein [Serratia symbiotica]|nr:Fimbrial domain-containing protein [Serratia symbiotica]
MKFKIFFLKIIILHIIINILHAEDGKINFQGSIIDSACIISTSSINQTIILGSVSIKEFTNIGSTASYAPFNIILTNCPDSITSAKIYFNGITHPDNNTILKLHPDQEANNIGIAIYDKNNKMQIPINTSITKEISLLPSITNTLEFVAKYFATNIPVTTGKANSNVSFTITYN